jgi:hypothetical protein
MVPKDCYPRIEQEEKEEENNDETTPREEKVKRMSKKKSLITKKGALTVCICYCCYLLFIHSQVVIRFLFGIID